MSDATMTPQASMKSRQIDDPTSFDYTPVPAIAPVSLVLGLIGLIGLVTLFGIAIALIALLVSMAAWRTIAVSEGQYGGKSLAMIGLVLALVGFAGGIFTQVQAYRTEMPDGFARISFNYDISKPGLEYVRGPQGQPMAMPPEMVESLDGQQVFVKGFMYPEQQQVGLKKFLLVKDSGDCCFGGQPAVQDMIGVKFDPTTDLSADFYNQKLVSVAGTFRIRRDIAGGSLEPIYEIEASHFSRAQSSF